MSKVWFVTGSSRGIGRALVEELLASTDVKVAATARNPDQLAELVKQYGADRLLALKVDVTQREQVFEAVAESVKKFGHLDVVVNNAGYGDMAALEEMPIEVFREQIEANFFGVVHVVQAVLPHLRQQRSGHILNVSSIGGRIASPGLTAYQAAKWAVEGMSEGLSKEVAPFDVKVTIIEPGGFRTDWAGSSMNMVQPSDDYKESVGRHMLGQTASSGFQRGDPKLAAKAMIQVANVADPPLRLLLGSDAYFLAQASASIKASEDAKWEALTNSTDFPDVPPAVKILGGFFPTFKLPIQEH